MASIEVKFCPTPATAEAVGECEGSGQEGVICYQIMHERRACTLQTDLRVHPSEWDERRGMVRADGKRAGYLLELRERIGEDVARLGRLTRRLGATGIPYSAEDVVEGYLRYMEAYSLAGFAWRVIAQLRAGG